MAQTAVVATTPAEPSAQALAKRPPKPDEDQFNKDLAQAEKAHKEAMNRYNAIRAKIDLIAPPKNAGGGGGGGGHPQSPAHRRQAQLIAEINEIRHKQAGGKNARTSKMDLVRRLDEQLRARLGEQKAARAKVPFKVVEDLDRRITDLEAEVGTGKMKLVDEKKHLNEISSLRKMRKNFGQLDEQQRQIDEIKARIREVKDSFDDPEQKVLSERYAAAQTELDTIKAELDKAYQGLAALRDERTKLQAEQQETFGRIRQIKDAYFSGKKAWQAYDREVRERARERARLTRERAVKERRRAEAEQLLTEAAEPAFLEEIRRAQSLLRFLDPTFDTGAKAPLLTNAGLGAEPLRKVDDAGIQGVRLVRKEDREDEYLPAAGRKSGKKGRKNNNTNNANNTTNNTNTTNTTATGPAAGTSPQDSSAAAAPAASVKYSCPPSVMADCSWMGIDPPMSPADVAATAEKVRAKLAMWKADQAAQTKKNIDKAKKEIERLERDGGRDDGGEKSDKEEVGGSDNTDADTNAGADVDVDAKKDADTNADANADGDVHVDADADANVNHANGGDSDTKVDEITADLGDVAASDHKEQEEETPAEEKKGGQETETKTAEEKTEDKTEMAEEKTDTAKETETAEDKTKTAEYKPETAQDKTETAEEKAEAAEKKTEAAEEKTETAQEKTETTEEKTVAVEEKTEKDKEGKAEGVIAEP